MDVNVYDSAYVQALEASVVVGGKINSSGQLVLIRGNGEEFNAGVVAVRYPVGSIFHTEVNYTPEALSTALGGGTWERYGKGKVIVSQNDAEAEFDTVGETGGAKTVALTDPAQNAPHTHGVNDPGHGHTGGANDPIFGGTAGEANFAEAGYNTGNNTTGISIASSGGGMGHQNLQPYIVAFVWRRTA